MAFSIAALGVGFYVFTGDMLFGPTATARVSLSIYNSEAEVLQFFAVLRKAEEMLLLLATRRPLGRPIRRLRVKPVCLVGI
jgi:hypothetical protein